MGGRQKKSASVATGKIGKEAIQAKLKQEEKLKLSRNGLTPPSWLDAFAAEEFSRVVDEAGNINLITWIFLFLQFIQMLIVDTLKLQSLLMKMELPEIEKLNTEFKKSLVLMYWRRKNTLNKSCSVPLN